MIRVGTPQKVLGVRHGTTKAGRDYTIIRLRDSKKMSNGEWSNQFLSAFIDGDVAVDKDEKITFAQIDALSVSESMTGSGVEVTFFCAASSVLTEEKPDLGSDLVPWMTKGDEMPF